MFDSFPDELKALNQWVCWRLEQRGDGKPSKVPYRTDGRRASSTNPDDWTGFDRACQKYASGQGQYSGVGFVFREGGGVTGVDLDRVIADGVLAPLAARAVKAFDSCSEVSVSGTGIHVICRGVIPDGKGHRREPFEVYDRGRYFTVTGRPYGEPKALRDCQAEIDRLLRWMDRRAKQDKKPTEAAPAKPNAYSGRRRYLSNSELLERARNARNGAKFRSLFDHGIIAGYRSHSEADLALLSLLRWWCKGDEDRAGELFGQSALYRKKWDRSDYKRHCFSFLQR